MNNFDKKLDDNSNEKNDENLEDKSESLFNKFENEELYKDLEEFSEKQSNKNIPVNEEDEEELLTRQLRDFRRNQIEASLYAAGRPITIEELSTKLEISKKEVEELINNLAFDYLERSTALLIIQIGESYQMTLKPEYLEKVSKFTKGGAIAERYLRTLTTIALKQPILKSLVVKMRGTGAYEHIKYLLDNGLITAVKKGRTHELTTTDKYAEMFELPKNKEEMKRKMIAQLGLDEVPSEDEVSSENEIPYEQEEEESQE